MADKNKERTFIMVKPDGVQRGLVGKIMKRFEVRGYKLVACKMCRPTKEHLEKHYAELSCQPFYQSLLEYVSSGPVVAMVWEGLEVVHIGRMMLGGTNPLESNPGTIRGDFCIQVGRNVCHGSDSVKNAQKEIGLWFAVSELMEWECCGKNWVYE